MWAVPQTAASVRVPLPAGCTEVLSEFSVALHKCGMYPQGHPALAPAVASLGSRLALLLRDREQLAIGVGTRQLIVEGAATDPQHAILRRLADTIHRHQIGAVTIARGVTPAEVAGMLDALARDAERHGAIGTHPPESRPAWPHIRLHPLNFDALALSGDPEHGGEAAPPAGHALWIGLARAALEGHAGGGADAASLTDPSCVAGAIDGRQDGASDEAIMGYLIQIARELCVGTGAEVAALRHRTARLIRAIGPEALRRLMRTCGDAAQRQTFMRDAVDGMAADAVVEIVHASADASGQTISHGLLRLLTKLAAHATHGADHTREEADQALRDHIGQMLSDWKLRDPNPADHGTLLQHVAVHDTASADSPRRTEEDEDPLRLVHMSLEGGWGGPMAERALEQALAGGHALPLLRLLADPSTDAAHTAPLRDALLKPEPLARLLSDPDASARDLDALQHGMTAREYGPLFDLLAATDNRAVRRRLLERLAQAPVDLRSQIVERLEDTRWFVQRNMLLLLERLGPVPDGIDIRPWAASADVRVRQQAIRVWLQHPFEREDAVTAALADGHPRLVHSALSAIQHDCPAPLADAVAGIALDGQGDPELRTLAIRALGQCRDARALDALLTLTDGGKTIFGRQKLAPRSPATIAALRSLAAGWRSHARADARLRLAASADDADLRHAIEAAHR